MPEVQEGKGCAEGEEVTGYDQFLKSKRLILPAHGKSITNEDIHPMLFPFQQDLTRWACRKGRSAIFADTGLGKTFMQLEWARLMSDRSLIVAPLSVARQTVREAKRIGLDVNYFRHHEAVKDGINITNYEMMDQVDTLAFDAVVLDESSILKALDGKTRRKLTDMFADTPYRLCCTATPAPNDIAELANHAEFLGIMSRTEMLAMFFVHDDEGWRLKGHAEEPFYRWLASWGMSIRMPSDLGYDDDGYVLPPLNITSVYVKTEARPDGQLFFTGLKGIQDRASVRKVTMADRVAAAKGILNGTGEQWIIWTGLNEEAATLKREIPGSVNVQGSDKAEDKAKNLEAFQDGDYKILLSKSRIAGFGMNFQNCHNMMFLGLNDSYEAYYQCIRRCYRFGQTEPVNVYVVISEIESDIYRNVLAKEAEASRMSQRLIDHVQQYERIEIGSIDMGFEYETDTVKEDDYTLMLGDSVERMKEIRDESIDLSVFSPPFMSLYTYSPTERDIGNSKDEQEFFGHFSYLIDELKRVTKPGRLVCCHVAQIPAMLVRDGYIGMKDFRGKTITAFENHGWVYQGECCIDKDPQAQAIRTHSKGLLFAQLKKDASWLRPALADYILVFRKPGENRTSIIPDLTNDEWIEFARPIWYGIRESNTLNVAEARSEKDERHICPLQLGTIERCIRLWSNKGETILDPFAGIGSTGHEAIRLGRKSIGIELKRPYFSVNVRNLKKAVAERDAGTLFEIAQ
jgi:DNA modification methylase/superfamily II DNA or RNA helicase